MKYWLYILILVSFLSDFRNLVENLGGAGKILSFMPELVGAAISIILVATIAGKRTIIVAPKYWIIGAFFSLIVMAGIILNGVAPGAIVSGIRNYFKYLPIFFVPAVYGLSDSDLKRLLFFLLVMSLLQMPVAILQYLFVYPHFPTGDVVRGMLGGSGVLSVYLCSVLAMVGAFYLKRHIDLKKFIVLATVLLIPLVLNDSRATIVFIMVALLTISFASGERGYRQLQNLAIAGLVSVLLVAGYVVAYDRAFSERYSERYKGGLLEFYLEGDAARGLNKKRNPGEGKSVSRIDSVVYAFNELNRDFPTLMLGLGAGNVVPAPFEGVEGKYLRRYADYGVKTSTLSRLLWETGILGVVISGIFLVVVWKDAKAIAASGRGLVPTIALGWIGVISVVAVSLGYNDVIPQNVSVVLIMLFSGYIATKRLEIRHGLRVFPERRMNIEG